MVIDLVLAANGAAATLLRPGCAPAGISVEVRGGWASDLEAAVVAIEILAERIRDEAGRQGVPMRTRAEIEMGRAGSA